MYVYTVYYNLNNSVLLQNVQAHNYKSHIKPTMCLMFSWFPLTQFYKIPVITLHI